MKRTCLEMAPRLDLRAVGPLQCEILARRGHDLTLDASRVELFGALAVQLVRSAARTWAEDGHVLALENTSSELADQLSLLGFTPETVTHWEPL